MFETLGRENGLLEGNMVGLDDGFTLTCTDGGEDGLRDGGHVG